MGGYEANPRNGNGIVYIRENPSEWNPKMERRAENLVDRLSALGVNDSSNDNSLIQVMKAVEAAESTIKQQDLNYWYSKSLLGTFYRPIIMLPKKHVGITEVEALQAKLAAVIAQRKLDEERYITDCDFIQRTEEQKKIIFELEQQRATAIAEKKVDENNRLRAELQKRTLELERRISYESADRPSHLDASRDEHIQGPFRTHQSVYSVGSQEDRYRWRDDSRIVDQKGALVVHQNVMQKSEDSTSHNHDENMHYMENNVNGALKVYPGGQAGGENGGVSQFSSPSSRSISPSRYQREGEVDFKNNTSFHGLMPISEVDNQTSLWKQDLMIKVREHEEEILQLRKHLADYSIKEAQIRNEKYVLEKRIAYMRMAFDQQQQDLVDAASKSLSYRQDIIEENIRLTYALQAAQQEKSVFISSLLPILSEYNLQPQVLDAQSIVTNLKVLFKHLQEKLLVTEAKLKESQYQLAPWGLESSDHPNITPKSPSPSIGAALTTTNMMGLELVPQPGYSQRQTPLSPVSDTQKTADWDPMVQHNPHNGFVGVPTKSMDPDNFGRTVPSAVRNSAAQDEPAQLASQSASHTRHYAEKITLKQPSFSDLVSSSDMDESDGPGKEPSAPWGSGNSSYLTPTHDDPSSSYSPYLPPVLEEPSSSFSEAGEDDPLPAIDGLQISGEAFPGQELQACGYSINGTTSCNFEWVRYLEDGSVNYIDGAKQPNYLVTADDVDTYLAIEVQPLDNRKRKESTCDWILDQLVERQLLFHQAKRVEGELVKVFTNDQRKITCDPEMQEQIEKSLFSGHASYEVSLAAKYLDIWEPAILAIKREGYSIKCIGTRGVVVTEKFMQKTAVSIPYGHPTAFAVQGSTEHLLRTESSALRDTIVLTMRLFIMRAAEKRKAKKKGIFFNK